MTCVQNNGQINKFFRLDTRVLLRICDVIPISYPIVCSAEAHLCQHEKTNNAKHHTPTITNSSKMMPFEERPFQCASARISIYFLTDKTIMFVPLAWGNRCNRGYRRFRRHSSSGQNRRHLGIADTGRLFAQERSNIEISLHQLNRWSLLNYFALRG